VLACSAKLWADNDYKSCSLPAPGNDDDADDDVIDDDDDDDTMKRNINYVIGDVLQPQETGNADAVIVHCVGEILTMTLCHRVHMVCFVY